MTSRLPAADLPLPRLQDYEWQSLVEWTREHENWVNDAAKGEAEIVFYGDSITAGWNQSGAWKKDWLPKKALALGIGGDCTHNVLWRLENGEVGKLKPKDVLLLIGSNNFGLLDQAPDEVGRGVQAVMKSLKEKFPSARPWVMAVFPSEQDPQHPKREKIRQVNVLIQNLAEKFKFNFVDLTQDFLDSQGKILQDLMPDFLHLSEGGYELWSAKLQKAMQAAPQKKSE